MPRKRFNPAETSLLQLGPGTPLAWRHGSHWLPGELLGEGRDTLGLPYAVVRNLRTTRTLSAGDHVRAYPGTLR